MPRANRTPEAKADVAEIWRYLALRNFDAAERWLAEIDDKVKLLARFPGLGPRRDELAPDLRSYPVRDYLIFYLWIKEGSRSFECCMALEIYASFSRGGSERAVGLQRQIVYKVLRTVPVPGGVASSPQEKKR